MALRQGCIISDTVSVVTPARGIQPYIGVSVTAAPSVAPPVFELQTDGVTWSPLYPLPIKPARWDQPGHKAQPELPERLGRKVRPEALDLPGHKAQPEPPEPPEPPAYRAWPVCRDRPGLRG
jgi:hypothetical protein